MIRSRVPIASRIAMLLPAVACAVALIAAQGDGASALEAARTKAMLDGDLRAAIRQYQEIAERYRSDGRIAAQALMHMAECYQKLGDAQAETIYQRIVREYSNQKEAAVARARLGGGRTTAAVKGDRVVWKGRKADLFGTVSPDGRYLSYVDWDTTGNLMLRDLASNTDRTLTGNRSHGEYGVAEWSTISRKGDLVAFAWDTPDGQSELRVAPLLGRGLPPSRIVVRKADEYFRPFDWSPDGKQLVTLFEKRNGPATIALVNVTDGSVRALKTLAIGAPEKIVFSADGRFIAYDVQHVPEGHHSSIVVMALDSLSEATIVANQSRNIVMGWAPDGQLVFTSNRSGAMSLWTVPVVHGQPAAAPRLVKADIGTSVSLGLTPSGTLYVWKYAGARSVRVASFDLEAGRIVDNGDGFEQFIESRGRPAWSRDGHLVFVSCGIAGAGPCRLFVRAPGADAAREVLPPFLVIGFPRLSPDGSTILTAGRDRDGRRGLRLVDVKTGARTLITETPGQFRDAAWSSDGQSIEYSADRDGEVVVVQRNLASAEETVIFRSSKLAAGSVARVSPDRRLVAAVTDDGKVTVVSVARMDGDPGADPVRLVVPTNWEGRYWQWLPGSDAVLLDVTSPDEEVCELWRVPLSGAPRRLPIDTRQWIEGGHPRVSPDGRYLAFVAAAGDPGAEVWALENFLPGRRSAAGARK